MKKLLFIIFLLPLFVHSQTKPLIIQGNSSNLYLTHTTGPKESFYSIGRIYNISPKVMAPYNQLILEKGLTIGQVVKIPLNEINFSQDGTVAADEAMIPLYYKVKPKETLYNISISNNKVPVETLKKWNKLNSDAVPNGSNMIVGYLKVKKELSPLSGGGVEVQRMIPASPVKATDTKEEVVVKEPVKKDPVITKTTIPVKKEEPPKKDPVKVETEVVKTTVPVKKETTTGSRTYDGGRFKSDFLKQTLNKEESGQAGTFKSTSGWEDGKYYCLHNTARAGSIIKITNPANQRAVYAKVLDVIPDIKQNEGMIIRLSNAAADELGIIAENFDSVLNY
ncbi:MAG: LysM peptidoglycan-binding domain-containing protein [Ferruginibacter sp.]